MPAIERLSLTDFRNYSSLDLDLDGRHVCLFGANGAGKTNLMEAISQLGPGRGLRGAALTELARMDGTGGWTIAARLAGDRRIGVAVEPGHSPKRTVRMDGAPASATDLADLIRIVWLTPAMDGVFTGGASERRRFFDRQVMAHIPLHGPIASRYERAMRERNALLEQPRVDPGWADAIEARLAELGAQLALNRRAVLEQLQIAINARDDSHFPKADLALEGEAGAVAGSDQGLFDLTDEIAAALRETRSRDAAAGRTLTGPHRADLAVIHRPTGAPAAKCSTGQQKALLIGLILASAGALQAREDAPSPILLLDEAAAHLDADRRAGLFDELCALGGQAWLTGTEAFLFEAFGDRAQRVEISNGAIVIA